MIKQLKSEAMQERGKAAERDDLRQGRGVATLEDVARAAGVHYSTVSRALDPNKVWRVNVVTRKHVQAVARRMGGYGRLTTFTADEFSARSRMHWLTTTNAGVAVGFTALLGLLAALLVIASHASCQPRTRRSTTR